MAKHLIDKDLNDRSHPDTTFDATLERMQSAKSKKAMKVAFDASPVKLGRSAVEIAKKSSTTPKLRISLPSAPPRSRSHRGAASSKAGST